MKGEPPRQEGEEWQQEQTARAEFPWFGTDAGGPAVSESPWIDTPASRAADEATAQAPQAEGLSTEDAVAAVDERRDRERIERGALGVANEDATALLEGHRLLRDARRQRHEQQSKVGRFIAGSALRAEQSGTTPDERAAGSTPERPRPQPRIWIGSLSDYNAGLLHGAWLDADQELDRLREDIVAILARSPTPGAEEWTIMDYDNFGAVTSQLGEYESLERVQTIARGIARYGEAFSAYVALAGPLQVDEMTAHRFERQFKGEWPELCTYAERQLQEQGAFAVLQQVASELPEQLRPYVALDVQAYADDLATELHVLTHEAGVWVFDLDEPIDNAEQENK